MFESSQPEILVLITGLIIFTLATLYFFKKSCSSHFKSIAYLVTATTVFSHLVMLSGKYIAVSSLGYPIYFSRWLFYVGSCSLLMYSIAQLLKKTNKQTLQMIYLNILVMTSGGFAAMVEPNFKWLLFAASSIFYVMLLYVLFADIKKPQFELKRIVAFYIFAGWTAFPVVFLLAPEGVGLINSLTALVLYLILDVFTKITFYLVLMKKGY